MTASGISGTNENTWSDSSVSSSFHDVFYSYNASCSGKATATLASTSSSLRLSAYWGSSCRSLHNVVDSDTGTTASVDFNVRNGEKYYLSVASTSFTVTAPFSLNVVCVPALTPLTPGDFCGNANTLTNGINLVSNAGATASGFGFGSSSTSSYRDLWYAYNATCTGKANFLYSRMQSDVDVVFASFEFGESCENVGASTYGNITDSQPQQITVPTTEGKVSYVVLAAYSSSKSFDVGDSVNVECISEPRPSNDRCFEATTFVVGTNISGTTVDATRSATKCNYPAVWYHTTAPCTGTLHFVIESDQSPYISFFDEFSTCTDLSSATGCSSMQSFQVRNGSSYYFHVYEDSALFNLSATCVPSEGGIPVNDVCAGAIALTGDVNATYSNENATKQINTKRCPESGENEIGTISNSDVWFMHTPNCSGFVTVTVMTETSNSFSYPHIIALTGDCSSQARLASCTEDLSNSASTVIPTVSGVPYYFAVATYSSNQGSFNLQTSCTTVTSAPTTTAPSAAPTTAAPSAPTSAGMTSAPSTGNSTGSNSTWAPTPKGYTYAPTTRRPTNVGETWEPTTRAPTAATVNGAAQAAPALALLAGALAVF